MKQDTNLPVIQSLWIGEAFSPMERLCASSFLAQGHEFHLYTYDFVKDVPAGVTLRDASGIIPPDKIFKYANADSYSGFSNLFRYKLVLEQGGYWVDTDEVCLQPFPNAPMIFFGERIKENPEEYQGVPGVIKAPPGSEIMQYCYEVADSYDPATLKWGQTGPRLLREAIDKFGLHEYVAEPDVFGPIDWWDWRKFIDGSVQLEDVQTATGLHFWNEMWRRGGANKWEEFPENSLFEQLKKRFLPSEVKLQE